MREGTTVQPKSTHDEEDYQWGLERFLDEAKTLAKFPHPNIVQVLRYFEANSTSYMVMRYEDGLPLNEILKKGNHLTEEELTQNILFPLLDGLTKVHAGGFLHRDIKPGNIYIRRADETPVLLDFGAARNALGSKSKSLTSIVTAGYAPFEQYHSDGDQGPWSDIYALGAVAYRIVTGEKPPEAPSRIKKDKMIPAIEAAKGKYSEQLLKAIDHALEMNEEDRPPSCDEWRQELAAQPISETPSTPEPGSNKKKAKKPTKLPPKKKVRWKVVLLSFLLPILGLFIVLFVVKQVHDQKERAAFEKKIIDIRSAAKEQQRLAKEQSFRVAEAEHARKLAEKLAIEKARKEAAAKIAAERKKKAVKAKVAIQQGQQKLVMEQARKKFNAYKEKYHVLQSVYFAANATHLGPASRAILDSVAKNYRFQLNQGKQVKFWLEGNTDNRGSRASNLEKGAQQADLVKKYLIKHGVESNDIDSVSFGEERPMCIGSGEVCWAFNRRVDIIKEEG